MRYYHGTSENFREFNLEKAENYKDFGKGIYLSEQYWHAESIAKRRNKAHAYIMIYDLNIYEMRKQLKVKEFKKASISWVDFVMLNRNRIIHTEYDVVIGATADASAQKLLEDFYNSHRKKKATRKEYRELIARLAICKYPRQICLLSQKALDYTNKRHSNTKIIY